RDRRLPARAGTTWAGQGSDAARTPRWPLQRIGSPGRTRQHPVAAVDVVVCSVPEGCRSATRQAAPVARLVRRAGPAARRTVACQATRQTPTPPATPAAVRTRPRPDQLHTRTRAGTTGVGRKRTSRPRP